MASCYPLPSCVLAVLNVKSSFLLLLQQVPTIPLWIELWVFTRQERILWKLLGRKAKPNKSCDSCCHSRVPYASLTKSLGVSLGGFGVRRNNPQDLDVLLHYWREVEVWVWLEKCWKRNSEIVFCKSNLLSIAENYFITNTQLKNLRYSIITAIQFVFYRWLYNMWNSCRVIHRRVWSCCR